MDITTNLELSTPCDHYSYNYKTKDYQYFSEKDCPICHGTGEVVTDAGEALLDFLRKHYR
jgi:hypothetical protein